MSVTSHVILMAEVSKEKRTSESGKIEMWTKYWTVPTQADAHIDTQPKEGPDFCSQCLGRMTPFVPEEG